MTTSSARYPRLQKSYKNAFPFKIATTSFIYPDKYVPNVDLLGPYLDEIEILFFESPGKPDPSLQLEMQALKNLAGRHGITYNIHLPLDVSISATASHGHRQAVEELHAIIALTVNLQPTTLTLHLPYSAAHQTKKDIRNWQISTAKGLELLLETGIAADKLSVETLDYPFEWATPLVEDFGLSVCIDFGHILVYGFDVEPVLSAHAHRTTIVHLHGVFEGRDHLPLDRMAQYHWDCLVPFLADFKKVVSLEVFSFDYLKRSLIFLEDYWDKNIA